ncbi:MULTISPECIES: hypothetical protein [unclassified Rhizobacter]|uniref:hypothetical protein n=1 Tax=unclassified Rhizobacter TaxID=2640088 RepID=UPI0006F60EDC|nr:MULTISPECIES: hypothetical protein [unclassified Rhizobacter]KQU75919.1 hypothetical protein ASC88_23680 [Rhizobacter sp. Root29]KQW06103.1 hypothetical protein ASC98_26320 [Rhizobacter sp. Root1238]KRB19418.1 hypothetical protein ASE08_23980 [Rhizobacter sp. Root16D2]
MESTQQVFVIRRTSKSTRIPRNTPPNTPPNTPREPAEKHRAQCDGSRQFLKRFRLTLAPSHEGVDPTVRNTLPERVHGNALQPAQATEPRRAQTMESNAGSTPGWSLLASMLKGSPTTGGLQKSISSALACAGDAAQFIAEADDCLKQARELSVRGALDVASQCRLGDLLHHCRVVQELLVPENPDPLTDLIHGLLDVAEFDPQQQNAAKLAAARQILGQLERRGGDGGGGGIGIGLARTKVGELEAKVNGRKARQVSAALQRWGLTHWQIDDCLRDEDALGAFIRASDALALQPEFERGSDGKPRVAGFAPIVAVSSADVAEMASAVAAQDTHPLAVQLLAAHALSRSLVDEDDGGFDRLLRLCATLWRQAGADDVSKRTLLRIARHLRLLIDCGLVCGEGQARNATRLLEEISLPSLEGRPMRLDDLASVGHVLQAAASNEWFACRRTSILRVAADVASDGAGWGREAIEQAVRCCDKAVAGRWHPEFLATLAERRDQGAIKAACSRLLAAGFPFTIVRTSGSSAVSWEADLSRREPGFTWARHGDAFMAFAHARLDQSSEMDPAEMQQWFDIVRVDRRLQHSKDRATLLALAVRAIGRSKELLDGIALREGLDKLALEPRTVHAAIARCGVDALESSVQLAAHKLVRPESNTVRVLLKHLMGSDMFNRAAASVPGRRMLDDLLVRVMADPMLLERRPVRDLLYRLLGAERVHPASRALHPVLFETLARSDKQVGPAVLECLLLLPLHERQQRAETIGFEPPRDLSFLFVPGGRVGQGGIGELLRRMGEIEPDRRLRIAALGAAMADSLGASERASSRNPNNAPLADGLLLLHEALPGAASADGREQAQHLVDIVRLTLRLIRERPGEASRAFFRLFPPLSDPAEVESVITSQGGRAISSEGRAIRSKGEPGLFAFAALLTCLYLIEDKPLPVADSFEAASLARLMCAALWFDAGCGLRCRQQLDRARQHAHRVQHWLLAPSWFSALRTELSEASATMSG